MLVKECIWSSSKKKRKAIASKKRRAYIRRKKNQEEKDLHRFEGKTNRLYLSADNVESCSSVDSNLEKGFRSNSTSLKGGSKIRAIMEFQNYSQSENNQAFENVEKTAFQSYPLKGGAKVVKLNKGHKASQLKLINRGTDCFVNSVIQMLRNTEYASFLTQNLPNIIVQDTEDRYKVAKTLGRIFGMIGSENEVSTAEIRTLVAQYSGKSYFDDNTQQDAEEFFRDLEAILSEELVGLDEYRNVQELHWGKEAYVRKFIDSSSNGKCNICGKNPGSKENQFLVMKLNNVPRASKSLSLSILIETYFSEDTQHISMRCPSCCEYQEHLKNKVKCPQTGVCRNRDTVEECQLIKAPKFLFIQVLRNIGNQPKLMTPIKFEDEITIPNGDTYEVLTTLDHVGNSPNEGHYVTHLKQASGRWMKCNDQLNSSCTKLQANTKNNYVFVLRRKDQNAEQTVQQILEVPKSLTKESEQQNDSRKCSNQDLDSYTNKLRELEEKKKKTKEDKNEITKIKRKLNTIRKQMAETKEERELRLSKDRQRKMQKIACETEEQKSIWLSRMKLRINEARGNETEDERLKRQADDRLRVNEAKKKETEDARLNRLADKRSRVNEAR